MGKGIASWLWKQRADPSRDLCHHTYTSSAFWEKHNWFELEITKKKHKKKRKTKIPWLAKHFRLQCALATVWAVRIMQAIKGAGQVHYEDSGVSLRLSQGLIASSVLPVCVRVTDCYWRPSRYTAESTQKWAGGLAVSQCFTNGGSERAVCGTVNLGR